MKKYVPKYGTKIKWVNYKSGVSCIRFKIETDKKSSLVCIDIINKNQGVREVFFEQFEEFKTLISKNMDDLVWDENYRTDSGKFISRIYTELKGPSINITSEWGEIYRFLEKNLVAIHEFWEVSQDIFLDLER
jgi:hypothetical protein